MRKKILIHGQPLAIRLRYSRILKYEQRGEFWVTDFYQRPEWATLSQSEMKALLLEAYKTLLDIGKTGSEYCCFSLKSIVLVEGKVFLDGIARGNTDFEQIKTDQGAFLAAVNSLPGILPFSNIDDCLNWLGMKSSYPPRRKPVRRGVLLVAIAFGLFCTAAGIFNYGTLNDGYRILSKIGPKAAYDYFAHRSESLDNTFGKAWTLFQLGEYGESEQLVEIVLKSTKMKHQADSFYLLGNIALRRGEYINAIETLDTAAIYYSRIDQSRGIYLATLSMANCYLLMDDAANGEFYLNKAMQIDPSQSSDLLLVLRSKLEFLNGNYQEALDLNLQRLSTFQNGQLSGGVYSEIGFYYGLLGDMEKALSYTLMAQQIAQQSEDVVLIHYNQVNWLLIYKCAGQDHAAFRESLLNWAEERKDTRLKKQIYFVDKFHCVFKRTDPVFPPPPPPDPPRENPPPEHLDN